MTPGATSLTYTAFNNVESIQKGVRHRTDFTYGPDRSRITRTDTARTGGVTSVTTTVYLGNVEHVIAADGSSSYKRTLAGGSVLITRDHDKTGKQTGETTRYLLKDHLGSLSRILDKHGSATQSFSYDAWGQRRHPHDAGMPASLTLSSPIHSRITPRGFTGHEMLDAVGLIHMNGRIYDPTLGRFLQADPVIQFPHYSQGQNPYSYVLNNPLTYTDPSGYFIGKLFKKVFGGLNKALGDFSPFLGIALLALPGMQPWVMQSWGHAFGFGFITGGIATGSLKGALFGGISVAAFVATGSQFVAETGFFQQGGLGHVLTHGITGGILAELQGGQFGHGFLAAGLSKAVMGRFSYADGSAPAVLGRTAVAATVGGTISRITGGKFANGALTSAMAQLFNAEKFAAKQARIRTPVSVSVEGNDVIIEYSDGSMEVRSGGTRAWRNNNPGNIRNAVFAEQRGSLGEAGGFAVFPNERAGRQALVDLLSTDTYQDLTINEAINRYAPPSENNTRNYQTLIQNFTDLSGGARMDSLNTQQLNNVAGAIGRMEGWRVGTITYQ